MTDYPGLRVRDKHPEPHLWQFITARSNYVMARVAICAGYTPAGILLAEQAIECYIKAIRHAGGERDVHGHELIDLLNEASPRPEYFETLLANQLLCAFLNELVAGSIRFGERGYDLHYSQTFGMLDEIVYHLDRTFRDREPKAGRRLYVPQTLRWYVLVENVHLSENDVTGNMLAILGED